MKKFFGLLILLAIIAGCSNNEVTIRNSAQGEVTFHFRGKSYDIPANGSTFIDNIPDGSFIFSSVYTLPSNVTKSSASGLSGSFKFINHGTKYSCEYASVTDTLQASTTTTTTSTTTTGASLNYTIGFTYSSNAY